VHADPESAKKMDNLTVFFVLLGSVCVKAAHEMFMKLTRDVATTNNEAHLQTIEVWNYFFILIPDDGFSIA